LASDLVDTAASIHNQQEVHQMPSKTRNTSTTATGEMQSSKKSSRGASVNRVILTGRLVATPELRTTGSGLHVTTVRIVTNDREQPEFHDVVLWRQMADFATAYMAKGRLAYVEGRLQGRTWEAADGSKRHTVEVVADRFQALTPKQVAEVTA
jgi:single-strand DNA-binding protein